MKKWFRSLAIIQHSENGKWLLVDQSSRDEFELISSEAASENSFRREIQRAVGKALKVDASRDILVSHMARINLEFYSNDSPLSQDSENIHFGVAFYRVDLYSRNARTSVESNSTLGWFTGKELLAGSSEDGKRVSPLTQWLLEKSSVIQSWD